MENLDKLLELLVQFVDDDSIRWSRKKEAILTKCKDDENLSSALDEFVSWFEEGDL